MDILQHGAHMILGLVASHPYVALFALVLLEEAGLPLPVSGDLLLIYAGYLVAQGDAQLPAVLGVVLVGAGVGALLPYSLARAGGLRAVRRFGRLIHLSEDRLPQVERWLERYRGRAIVFGRQVPGGRVPTSIVAGTFGVPPSFFLTYSAIGSLLWAGTFLLLGAHFGDRLLSLASRVDGVGALGLATAALGIYAAVRFSRRAFRRLAS